MYTTQSKMISRAIWVEKKARLENQPPKERCPKVFLFKRPG